MSRNEVENILPIMKLRESHPSRDASLHMLEESFERYWGSIVRLLMRMLGDPAEAEDLALETFYRLYQRHPDPAQDFNIGGWLYRVAANLGLQSIRSWRRRERYELMSQKAELAGTSEQSPAAIFDEEEERRLARLALAALNPRQAQLLVLRYSGMAYKDIARSLNLSPSSIGPLLLRAERQFAERYRALIQEDS